MLGFVQLKSQQYVILNEGELHEGMLSGSIFQNRNLGNNRGTHHLNDDCWCFTYLLACRKNRQTYFHHPVSNKNIILKIECLRHQILSRPHRLFWPKPFSCYARDSHDEQWSLSQRWYRRHFDQRTQRKSKLFWHVLYTSTCLEIAMGKQIMPGHYQMYKTIERYCNPSVERYKASGATKKLND